MQYLFISYDYLLWLVDVSLAKTWRSLIIIITAIIIPTLLLLY